MIDYLLKKRFCYLETMLIMVITYLIYNSENDTKMFFLFIYFLFYFCRKRRFE